MNAQELFNLAPHGATVTYTDNKPRPPDRFKNKLREWQRSNGKGFFVKSSPSSGHEWSSDTFIIQELSSDVLIINMHHGVKNSALVYTVEPRPVGALIAYGDYGGEIEVKYVWPSVEAAQAWMVRKGYAFKTYGYKHFIVREGDTLEAWEPVFA